MAELRCVLPASVAKERIARRMASLYNPSDATPDLVDHMAARFDDWPEAAQIDTSGTVADTLAAARRAVGPPDVPARSRTAPTRFSVDLTRLRNAVLIRGGLFEAPPDRRR